MKEYEKALKCFKKQLEQAWAEFDVMFEIRAYEKIAVQYFYLGDLQKSKYYHDRAIRGQVIGDNLRRVFQRKHENMKKRSQENQYDYEEENSLQKHLLTESKLKEYIDNTQHSLQVGIYDEKHATPSLEFTLTPQEVYSQHLSLNIGPIIRKGTPISDLSLSDLPSPRSINEASGVDINNVGVLYSSFLTPQIATNNDWEQDDGKLDFYKLTPHSIKIEKIKAKRVVSLLEKRSPLLQLLYRKRKPDNPIEKMRLERKERMNQLQPSNNSHNSLNESRNDKHNESSTKVLKLPQFPIQKGILLRKMEEKMNQRTTQAILNHMSNSRNQKQRYQINKGYAKITADEFKSFSNYVRIQLNLAEDQCRKIEVLNSINKAIALQRDKKNKGFRIIKSKGSDVKLPTKDSQQKEINFEESSEINKKKFMSMLVNKMKIKNNV